MLNTFTPYPTLAPVADGNAVFLLLQRLWVGDPEATTPEEDPALPLSPIAETVRMLDAMACSGYQCYTVIDMLTQQYLYLSPNQAQLTGCPLEEVYAGGMCWLFNRIHPDDLAPLVEINEAKWGFYQSLPEAERPHFRANFDFRARNADGRYRRVQQQSLCLRHTPAGLPHIILAQLVDITHLKPSVLPEGHEKPALLLTIHTGGPDRLVLQCSPQGSMRRTQPLLSAREQQVLARLDLGLSSRAIAEELGTSAATVDTQRRQMLRKTGTIDTTALVSYARLLGWL